MHVAVVRPENVASGLVGVGDEARRMHPHRQRGLAELGKCFGEHVDVGTEAGRVAADDGEHDGQAVMGGADDGARTAADADPGGQRAFGARVDDRVDQRGAEVALPGDALLGNQLVEQVELLLEQVLVLVEREAETAGKLSVKEPRPTMISARPLETASSVGEALETREPGSSELSTVTAEPRRMRSVRRRDGGKDHLGGRDGKIGAMVFTDAEEVEPEAVGEDALLDDVADHLGGRRACASGAGHVAEGVEAEMQIMRAHDR